MCSVIIARLRGNGNKEKLADWLAGELVDWRSVVLLKAKKILLFLLFLAGKKTENGKRKMENSHLKFLP